MKKPMPKLPAGSAKKPMPFASKMKKSMTPMAPDKKAMMPKPFKKGGKVC